MTAYAHVFAPDRYSFRGDEMRAHWVEQVADAGATTVIAEREPVAVGFVVVSPGGCGTSSSCRASGDAARAARSTTPPPTCYATPARERACGCSRRTSGARRFYEHRGWRDGGGRRRAGYAPYPREVRYELEL